MNSHRISHQRRGNLFRPTLNLTLTHFKALPLIAHLQVYGDRLIAWHYSSILTTIADNFYLSQSLN